MIKPGSASRPLKREEWDFSQLPARELAACLLWEHAREWGDTEAAVHGLNEVCQTEVEAGNITDSATIAEAYPDELDERSGIQNIEMIRAMVHHLNTPWQLLPQKTRLEAVTMLSSIFFEIHSTEGEDIRWNSPRRGKGQHAACFMVDWRAHDAQLLEEFAGWLNRNRREPPKEARGNNPRNQLKQIASMRLLHCYSLEEAMQVTTKALGKPLYPHRQGWERARQSALVTFRTRFLFDWRSFVKPPFPASYPRLRKLPAVES